MREFFRREWQDLCERTKRSAEYLGEECSREATDFMSAAEEFCVQEPPERYDELLDRYRAASRMAVQWQSALH